MNRAGASAVGRLILGTCADRYNPWFLALTTLSAASGTVFVFWGILARNISGLIAFGIVYGVLASGWSSLWTGFLK
jgi:MFS transporter, MCT family, solute carrier family 16 (monocarboxylic acid transporters), member 10